MLQLYFTSILSFAITIVIGIFAIPVLIRLKFGQTVREDGPRRHLKKTGTPTIGGVIFIPAVAIAALVFAGASARTLAAVMCMLSFGTIGYIDDYIKTSLKRSLGLRANQKLLLQLIFSWALSLYAHNVSPNTTVIMAPFFSKGIDVGFLFIPFTMFVIISTVNSVNIADGLDGLVSGIMAVVSFFYTLVMLKLGLEDLSFFSAAITGGCIGFLVYNFYPAKVFMGDTGSLGLGGALAALLVLSGTQFYMLAFGMIFFIEALSVVIQVIFFKATGRRIFRMSPLHHHFELVGWSERKVVFVFWGFTLITCVLGYVVFIATSF